jgi:hypothetical protein
MNIKVRFLDGAHGAVLTTDHPRSSYGIPVLVPDYALSFYMRSDCYSAADIAYEVPLVLDGPATPEELEVIKAAGFRIED